MSSQDSDLKLKTFKKELVEKSVKEFKKGNIKTSNFEAPVPIKCEESSDLLTINPKDLIISKDEQTEDNEKEDIEKGKSSMENTIIFIPPPTVLPGPRFDPRLTARPVTAGDMVDYWDSRLENDIIKTPDTKKRY